MVMKLDEKKTLFVGLLITLGITILGGIILTTFLMPECRDIVI
ncbi:MAG: hypothetical protein OEM28_07310 [Nitrosopumilus sp.]|nr:hypothetical protein [Nitrosopumilus sp.]MDH3488071.1 hypothetical protein [Nitrosopumilus sp.]